MGRLRQQANQQAQAEYGPQKRRARREAGSQIRSIRSMVPALEDSLRMASRYAAHSGLNPQDARIARLEFANRIADAGASAALQEGQVRQDTRQTLVDLSEAQGQAAAATLAQLQAAAQERRQSIADDHRHGEEDIAGAIKQKILEQQLGLTDDSSGGLTPTQRRALKTEHDNAAFYAKSLFQAIRDGAEDKEGNRIAGPHPQQWDDSVWDAITNNVLKRDGVNDVKAAKRAVKAIRDHVQPQSHLLQSLGVLAGAGGAVAPDPDLRTILQFGSRLLR